MKTTQYCFENDEWDKPIICDLDARLVFAIGSVALYCGVKRQLKEAFPNAEIIGCTTAGVIQNTEILDDVLAITVVNLDSSRVRIATESITEQDIASAADKLACALPDDDLKYVMVLSDGHVVNGSELARCLNIALPTEVICTGGLAADGTDFKQTYVWHNDICYEGVVLVCGFYGANLHVGFGSEGGWDPFGPERIVTESDKNVLYTLDDKPALALYEKYLGEHANELPAAALRFPLLVRYPRSDTNDAKQKCKPVIRTILDVDKQKRSMTFAGDIPRGSTATLMKANFERLIDASEIAAESASKAISHDMCNGLVFMVSCVGRRLVLNQRTEEELEVAYDILGPSFNYLGFYSYGELAPNNHSSHTRLHNQTMTITLIYES
ncbi:hypothetical protein C2869_08010 [Saccharobesus litoralis]|uniref:Uncharacterized protein n=1 Tax=Saccharobesus litoralis TaxID=2172099 RepID=A0A2S0VQ82_9ALTE|nr:FIST N-terminal domain-containing protein [Saccharobesus litoralis]AWB66375.1 hypothetical protein C2869_08010 [Saccharobesus litoralis]